MATAYPSINFKNSVVSPQQASPAWRNSVGVVAEFNKGPIGAISLNPQNFDLLYGNDGSNGAANVQQLYNLGASNLVVSRAVPQNGPSSGSIFLASGNPNKVAPKVGYEVSGSSDYDPVINTTSYTIGAALEFHYIGSPIVEKSIYNSVSTIVSRLEHPSFSQTNEQANFRFVVTGFVAGGTQVAQTDPTKTITVTAVAGTAGEYQVITFSSTESGSNDVNEVLPNIRQGYELAVLTSGAITTRTFTIVSNPFVINSTTYGLLVQNKGTVTAGSIASLGVVDPSADHYVIGYQTQVILGSTLQTIASNSQYFTLPNATYNNGFNTVVIDSYFILPAASGGIEIPFAYQIIANSVNQTEAYAVSTEGLSSNSSSEGIILVFGTLGTTSLIRLIIGGQFNIPVASSYITAGSSSAGSSLAYTVGTSALTILNDLYNSAISNPTFNSLLQDIEPSTAFFPYGFNLESQLVGIDSNRVKVRFDRFTSGEQSASNDIFVSINGGAYTTIPPVSFTPLTGGITGPSYGTRDFYDVNGKPLIRITALSPGATNIQVSITPQSTVSSSYSQFLLSVVYTASDGTITTEGFNLNSSSVDPNTGLFTQSINSNLVRVYFIPYIENSGATVPAFYFAELPIRATPGFALYSSNYSSDGDASAFGVVYTSNLPLLGGSDYTQSIPLLTATQIRQAAYLDAINSLANSNVSIIVIVGIQYGDSNYSNVFNTAIQQINDRTAEVGIAQLLLEAPLNSSPTKLGALSSQINNQYVSIINGHIVQLLTNGNYARNIGVLGYYAGLAVTRPPQISPHAPYAGQFLPYIVSSDTQNTPTYKTAVANADVDSLYYDGGLQGWKFLDGLTTSSSNSGTYFSVNRIQIQVISDLYNILQWIRSMPNTPSLQNQVSSQVNSYLQTKLQAGWFLALGDIICNSTNNSQTDLITGKLNIQFSYCPVIPADYINVGMIQDYTLVDTLSLSTTPLPSAS